MRIKLVKLKKKTEESYDNFAFCMLSICEVEEESKERASLLNMNSNNCTFYFTNLIIILYLITFVFCIALLPCTFSHTNNTQHTHTEKQALYEMRRKRFHEFEINVRFRILSYP